MIPTAANFYDGMSDFLEKQWGVKQPKWADLTNEKREKLETERSRTIINAVKITGLNSDKYLELVGSANPK